jgi:outer membrane lipoprotein-sorting protein
MKSPFLRIALLSLLPTLLVATAIGEQTDPVLKQATERCSKFKADVHDMHMVQVMQTYMPDGQMTLEQTVYTKGDKSRVEMKLPLGDATGDSTQAMETIMVNDGTNAWMFSPFGGKQQLSPEEAERNEPSRNCWGYFPDNARVTGDEQAQGRDCYVVEMDDEGAHTKLWLDKKNFMSVQGETRDSTGEGNFHWKHSDFHPIQGDWEYPFMTEMYDGDTLAATLKVTSLEVNQGLSDDLFDPDKVHVEALQLDMDQLMQMMAQPEDSEGTK